MSEKMNKQFEELVSTESEKYSNVDDTKTKMCD